MSQPTTVTPKNTTTVVCFKHEDGTTEVRVTMPRTRPSKCASKRERERKTATQETQTEPLTKMPRRNPMEHGGACVDLERLLGKDGIYGVMYMPLPENDALGVTPNGEWKVRSGLSREDDHLLFANMADDSLCYDGKPSCAKLLALVLRDGLPYILDPSSDPDAVDTEAYRVRKAVSWRHDVLATRNPEELYQPAAVYEWAEGAWRCVQCWDPSILGYEVSPIDDALEQARPLITGRNGPFTRVFICVETGTDRPHGEWARLGIYTATTTRWAIPTNSREPYEILELALRDELNCVLIAPSPCAALDSEAFRACGVLLWDNHALALASPFDHYDVVRRFARDSVIDSWKAI